MVKDEYDEELDQSQICIMKSFPPKIIDDVEYNSYHIVVNSKKAFKSVFTISDLVKRYFSNYEEIDQSVYKTYQKMRVIDSTKSAIDRRKFKLVSLDDLDTPIEATEQQKLACLIQTYNTDYYDYDDDLFIINRDPNVKLHDVDEFDATMAEIKSILKSSPLRYPSYVKILKHFAAYFRSYENSVRCFKQFEETAIVVIEAINACGRRLLNSDYRLGVGSNPTRLSYIWNNCKLIDNITAHNLITYVEKYIVDSLTVDDNSVKIINPSELNDYDYNNERVNICNTKIYKPDHEVSIMMFNYVDDHERKVELYNRDNLEETLTVTGSMFQLITTNNIETKNYTVTYVNLLDPTGCKSYDMRELHTIIVRD
jgi:hypothetical protein